MQLIVDGKPIVLLSGELTNSAGSSMDYMEPVWAQLKRLHLNAVLAPITWEMIEPEEGRFDFSSLDALIAKARIHDMKLVLLWFATWKNAGSSYPPAWVRQDLKRFPHRQNPEGKNTNALSCFAEEAWMADGKALAAVMKHLKQIDSDKNTVVAVQVQNEPGVRNFPRDYSPVAEKYFKSKVPDELISFLRKNKNTLILEFDAIWKKSNYKTNGNWSEIFGEDAAEIFMAWYIASYIDKVAMAGKREYPLPMFANAWLEGPKGVPKPGDYPSGGPTAKMVPVYQAAAPHLDFLAPDIYRPDFDVICGLFKRMGNPLFIPEANINANMAANVFYAVGEDALCFSPFGIDNRLEAKDTTVLRNSYGTLSKLLPIITEYQGTGKMRGVLVPAGETKILEIGDYKLKIEALKNRELPAYGIIIAKENNEFLVTGDGFNLTFLSTSKRLPHAELLWAYELVYRDGQWVKQRRLNGDETGRGSDHNILLQFLANEPIVLTTKLFSYE
ncbi:DUF5597 domain-containing protein [Chitinophaga sp. MM2321]|uniref:GH35 family beta-galactosidase n=1 Tax=Chitinophaga sp. MM2321 TaxID=3137178 RepID=UPI0032D5AACB